MNPTDQLKYSVVSGLVTIQLIDSLQTLYLIDLIGFSEGNSFMMVLFNLFGTPFGLWIGKTLFFVVFLFSLKILNSYRVIKVVFIPLTTIGIGTIIWNVCQFVLHKG